MRPVANPPNPWSSQHTELLGEAPDAVLQVFEEDAKSIVAENQSPDIPFRWSLNPYRGCFHGCAYCYARPTHQYLGFGAGTDFERRIVVKRNAAQLLRARLMRESWRGENLVFSGVTDCYQPLEASYRLTRSCLEVCAEFRQPVGVITKGALVERDVDLLARLATHGAATVFVSVPFADDADSRAIEPFVALPARRLRALRTLADAGVPVGVSVSPLIPGLNDHQIPAILEAARDAGATQAFHVLLRLPSEVEQVFSERLRQAFPLRADKVLLLVRQMRGGRSNDARFGSRMRGEGARYQLIADLFDRTARRLGMTAPRPAAAASPFRRPNRQLGLFGGDA
ncbi:MAG: PA0069 family radical SAM protein [Planctomycetes bacterium]|nr:PA0069 family radical SAM protein [Planctomycetota bacterium]